MRERTSEHKTVRWHNSLIVRMMVLCAVLVLCLLGSVYVLTIHYYREVVGEMDTQARDIENRVQIWLEENPEADLENAEVQDQITATLNDVQLDFSMVPEPAKRPNTITPQLLDNLYAYEATRTIRLADGRYCEITALFTFKPQTEIVRAFKNRYLILLSAAFMVTLGAMIYLIEKTLQPLRELSNSCAKIAEGTLRPVTTHAKTGEILALEQTFNGMVASLRDKELVEANLRQAQRLSAIGNLAAGVAHDVRNPLNAIKLLSSHALDTLDGSPESEPAAKQLRTIRSEVNRLEEIVAGFLSLAREEELRPEPRSIDAILSECSRLVQKDAEARNVRFLVELRCGDTMLMIDPKQWTRAILNVLINALEATPSGGRVRLYSRMTDQRCEIEIRDDGPGMPREVLEHAFDAYFTTKTTGTGLGLSITRGIIEEHGGTVTLSSHAGQGTQVLIVVALHRAVEPAVV